MYNEDDLLPLSALQHLAFCPRQCALIHIERVWADNLYTVEGNILHESVDAGKVETRPGIHIARSIEIRSLRLGLVGIADLVEFSKTPPTVLPIEFKRGRKKASDIDRIQLCAQGICLEEVLRCTIESGAIFYGKTRRREQVVFTSDLRENVSQTSRALHQLIDTGKTPPPTIGPHCDACSLREYCLPQTASRKHRVGAWLNRMTKGESSDA